MKALTVSETGGIHVNGYPAASIDALGFEYTYLYYEPEGSNMFKFVQVGDDLVRVDLTDSEKAACAAFCNSYEPDVVVTEGDETPVEDPQISFVTADGRVGGVKKRSELEDGETEVSAEVLAASGFSNSVVPEAIWNADEGLFEGKTYKDKRLYSYYDQIKYNDQFAALWAFVQAMADAGASIPSEAQAILDKIASIKADNPKV